MATFMKSISTLILGATLILVQDLVGTSLALNPLRNFSNDPDWQERLIGSYGFLSGREPRISPEERDLLEELRAYIPNNIPTAISTVEAVLTPESSAAINFILGNLFFQTEDMTRAEQQYRLAIEKFPDFLRVYKNLSIISFRSDRLDLATKYLAKSLELGDVDAKTYGMLGYCHQFAGRLLSAESAFRMAMISEPENEDWKMLLTQTLLGQGRYSEALNMVEEMLLEDPDNMNLWLAQANSYMGVGENIKAATNFEIVRRMGKATPASLILLGNIYINRQLLDLALEAFVSAIDRDPKQPINPTIAAAEALANYGAYDEAETLIRKIYQAYNGRISEKREMRLLTTQSQVAIALGKGEEAAEALEKVIERDPLNGRALTTLANYYGTEGQSERAIILFERAEDLDDGTRLIALRSHGQLMVHLKEWEAAVALLRRAQSEEHSENVEEYLKQVEQVARAKGARI